MYDVLKRFSLNRRWCHRIIIDNIVSFFKTFVFSDHFEIDSGTGIVRLAESILDGEEEYFVEIMAKDKGTPSLNSSYVLEVTVIDVNTHDPEFVNLPPDSAIVVDEVNYFDSHLFACSCFR